MDQKILSYLEINGPQFHFAFILDKLNNLPAKALNYHKIPRL